MNHKEEKAVLVSVIPQYQTVTKTYEYLQELAFLASTIGIETKRNFTQRLEFPDKRTFIGKGSEGGLVLLALFIENQETAVFDNFIVTDPSPKYASAIIELIEKDSISENQLNKKLHYSFSTSNDRAKCIKLIDLIKDANYQWLQVESIEYTKSNYENTYPISYAAGIKYVFNK